MSVRCGHCHETHNYLTTVQLCSQGLTRPCGDLVDRGYDEDGSPVITPCDAPSFATPRGYACDAGHSYVDMETRDREGWDYHDADDIGTAREHGVLVFTGPDGETQPW